MKTIGEALKGASLYLAERGVENSSLDAEILLAYLLGVERAELYINLDEPLESLTTFNELLKRRARFEPVAYIIGKKEFMSIEFKVTKATLIPRPETELLVEKALEIAKEIPNPLIVDIGTGCGAIGISIAKELEICSVIATDISADAIEVAKENARCIGVSNKVTILQGSLFSPLENFKGKINMVISNPPYIPSDELETLPKEVLFEPKVALNGGREGVVVIEQIVSEAHAYLTHGGYLLVEVGENQSRRVKEMIMENPLYCKIEIFKDYAGVERVILAQVKN
jgi:release factor glutamine methyltransferase